MNKVRHLNKKLVVAGIALLVSTFVTAFLFGSPASAMEDYTKKAALQALTRNCHAHMQTNIAIGDFRGIDGLLGSSNSGDILPLPSGEKYSSVADETLDCFALIKGYTGLAEGFEGVYSSSAFGAQAPSSNSSHSERRSFLTEKAGYKEGASSTGSKCVSFAFVRYYEDMAGNRTYYDKEGKILNEKATVSNSELTSQFCANVSSDGSISGPLVDKGGTKAPLGSAFSYSSQQPQTLKVAMRKKITSDYGENIIQPVYEDVSINAKWDTIVSRLEEKVKNSSYIGSSQCGDTYYTSEVSCPSNKSERGYLYVGAVSNDDDHSTDASFSLLGKSDFMNAVVSGLYGGGNIYMSEQDTIRLYAYYMTLFNAKIDCVMSEAASSNYTRIKWFENGESAVSECYVTSISTTRTDGRGGDRVNGVDGNGIFQNDSMGSSDLVNFFANLNVDVLDDPVASGESSNASDSETTCWDNSGALGWIICPLIDTLSSFIQFVYGSVIEPMLRTNVSLFSTEENGTYGAWGVFRNISNIIFIIIFIVVIFSQLTGVGIDNYGIKKTLPKLIVGAVLVNLSFIVCQLAIDISNITGSGIQGLFSGIKTAVIQGEGIRYLAGSDAGSSATIWQSLTSHLVAIGVVGGVALIAGSVAVLGALVSAAISVAVMFLFLGVRQALAVLLVAISPLAFICYILPSTKPIFDRWLKTLQGVLLAYPICSALIFGGDLVAAILLRAADPNDLIIGLTALIISVAPIFLLPMLLQRTMGAAGSIAGKLQGMTSKAGRDAFGRSGLASDLERSRAMRRAGMVVDKDNNPRLTWRGHLQDATTFTRGARRRLSARRTAATKSAAEFATMNRSGEEDISQARNVLGAAVAGRADQDVRDFVSSVNNGQVKVNGIKDSNGNVVEFNARDTNHVQQALTKALRDNDTTAIRGYTDILSGQGNKGHTAIRDAFEQAQADAAQTGGLDKNAIKTFSGNIVSNHSELKASTRSLHDYAMATQATGENTDQNTFGGSNDLADFTHVKDEGDIEASQLLTMDKDELRRLVVHHQTDLSGVARRAVKSEAGKNVSQERLNEIRNLY